MSYTLIGRMSDTRHNRHRKEYPSVCSLSMSLCTSYSSSYPWSTGFYGTIIPQGVCIIKQFLFEQTHLVAKKKNFRRRKFYSLYSAYSAVSSFLSPLSLSTEPTAHLVISNLVFAEPDSRVKTSSLAFTIFP